MGILEYMRIPKRKPGKYGGEYDPRLTPEKFAELQATLKRLKAAQPRAAAEAQRLAAHGDFSENAGYSVAKAKLRGINQHILELEDRIKHATIIQPPTDTSRVQIGHRVTIEVNGNQATYQILGSSETDPTKGVISHSSPLGAALVGRKVGDVVTLSTARGSTQYTIIQIQ